MLEDTYLEAASSGYLLIRYDQKSHPSFDEIMDRIFNIKQIRHLGIYEGIEFSNPRRINLLENIESIDLHSCEAGMVKSMISSINKLPKLKKLSITDCGIDSIYLDNLHLGQLIDLDLSSNAISNPRGFLKDCLYLEILNLSYNNLTEFPPELSYLSNLKQVDLSNNLIRRFNLNGNLISRITHLNLNSNFILDIPLNISRFQSLQQLDLSHNRIESLEGAIFKITSLLNLYMSHNQIRTIPMSIEDLVNINLIDLSYNYISDLPSSMLNLKNLKSLLLQFNRFELAPEAITKYIPTENIESAFISVASGETGKSIIISLSRENGLLQTHFFSTVTPEW